MSKEKPKPYTTMVLIFIILITSLSIGILVIMSSSLLDESKRFTETADFFDNMATIADNDIQTILQEDNTKYDVTFSYLSDMYYLNNKYYSMLEYNTTHPATYSQLQFDEVKMEFVLLIQSIISIVNDSTAFKFSTMYLDANLANNFSYFGFENYLITNVWFEWVSDVGTINPEIISYIENAFAIAIKPLYIPIINIEKWTYHLYNDLSALDDLQATKLLDYIEGYSEDLSLTLENLSLTYIAVYRDGYISLAEKMDTIITNLNNTIITLALAGVLMGFATSFDNINFRRVSLIVGILIFVLAMIYFMSAIGTLIAMPANEAALIGSRSFTFM
ncbi:MAG: hypothetical protein FK734_10035 [Asgard group archaeon]|nr:hypothetical protein [Asgard group archaeon]